MGEKMTLADALSKAQPYTVMHGKSGQYPDGSGWGHAWNEEGMWLPREAWSVIRAHLAQPAQEVDVEAIREVIAFIRSRRHGAIWEGGAADKLEAALPNANGKDTPDAAR